MPSKKKSKKPSKKKSKKKSTAKPAKKVRRSTKARAARKPGKKKAAQKRKGSRRNLIAAGIASPRRSATFEGASRAEQADSESVEELVEEGNLFEAGAVAGVEEADDADEKEVRTHELPEDDVPEEYLDKD